MLDAQAVSVELGGRTVLRNVSLQLASGELLALLGPSGCGKTTLLRAVAGLQDLSAGRLLLSGRDVSHVHPQQRDLGMVFQNYALFPNLTVRENVCFGPLARGHRRDAASKRAEELLALVGLSDLAGRRPMELSGGQRQRVALARALANRPALLLLDEPFSALDEQLRVPLRRAFRELQRSLGQSSILVTHDREEAFELADRIGIMIDGRIVQCGTPEELRRAPASLTVANFLGSFNRVPSARVPNADASQAWLAPVTAFEPDEGPAPEAAIHLRGVVRAAYPGQQRTVVHIETPGGDALSAWYEPTRAPCHGQTVHVRVRADALHPVPIES